MMLYNKHYFYLPLQEVHWINQDPLTFQIWQNINYKKKSSFVPETFLHSLSSLVYPYKGLKRLIPFCCLNEVKQSYNELNPKVGNSKKMCTHDAFKFS